MMVNEANWPCCDRLRRQCYHKQNPILLVGVRRADQRSQLHKEIALQRKGTLETNPVGNYDLSPEVHDDINLQRGK